MLAPICLLHLFVLGLYISCFKVVYGQNISDSNTDINATDSDAAGRALSEVLPGSTTTGKYGPDAIPVGNYMLIGCSTDSANSRADYLTRIFPTWLATLQGAITEAHMVSGGYHGYTTFFKNTPRDTVETVLANIKRGTSLTFRTTQGSRVEKPKIICLSESDEGGHVTGIGNLYNYFCTEAAEHRVFATQFRRSELVILCPDFFSLAIWPTIQECPRVVAAGGLVPDGTQLMDNQYSLIIRALSGLYIPASRRRTPSPADTPATLREVVASIQATAQRSEDAFAYYAACESLQSCLNRASMLLHC